VVAGWARDSVGVVVPPPDDPLTDPDSELDPVDEEIDESFPASDPSSTWAGEDPDEPAPPTGPEVYPGRAKEQH
jgi:hypothetical protein